MYAGDGRARRGVDVATDHRQRPPSLEVEVLLAPDVTAPLPAALAVMTAVVLDGNPCVGVLQVGRGQPASGAVVDRLTDNRLR